MSTMTDQTTAIVGHTPGPWEPVDRAIEADDPERPGFGVVVAWVSDDVDESTSRANARLIAAAPELLAVLGDAVRELRIWLDNHREDVSGIYDEAVPVGDEIIARAVAALHKAEDRSHD